MAVQLDGEQLHLDTILPEYLEESDLPASTIAAIDTIISGSDVNDNFTVSKKDRYQSIGTQTNPMPAPVLQCDSGLMAEPQAKQALAKQASAKPSVTFCATVLRSRLRYHKPNTARSYIWFDASIRRQSQGPSLLA